MKEKIWERPWFLLLCGLLLTLASQMRWGVSGLAWLAPVPYLRYLRLTSGGAAKGWFIGVYLSGWVFATLKITTSPLPWALALVFGILIGGILVVGFLLWDHLRKGLSPSWAGLAFAATMVCLEWLQHVYTPLASWGAAAYTQIGNLVLLQSLSLFGMAGVGFLVYWVAATLEWSWWEGFGWQKHHGALLLVCVLCYGYGAIRLSVSEKREERLTLVATVGTDATFGGLPLPSRKRLRTINAALFERTRKAAQAGAKMVVWNEGATLVRKAEEGAWKRRLQALARASKVELVAAYIVPLQRRPLRYENKYLWFRPDGSLGQLYLKHKPVLGEPAIAGKRPHRALKTSFGRVSGAICYDYDYPRLAAAHSHLGVGLVFVPSSDWKGIDPIHTHMASFRAIEGGFSLLRSTRLGLSAGIDAHGRFRAWQSAFDRHERIMWVRLPTISTPTLYARIGDLFVLLSALGICLALWHRHKPAST